MKKQSQADVVHHLALQIIPRLEDSMHAAVPDCFKDSSFPYFVGPYSDFVAARQRVDPHFSFNDTDSHSAGLFFGGSDPFIYLAPDLCLNLDAVVDCSLTTSPPVTEVLAHELAHAAHWQLAPHRFVHSKRPYFPRDAYFEGAADYFAFHALGSPLPVSGSFHDPYFAGCVMFSYLARELSDPLRKTTHTFPRSRHEVLHPHEYLTRALHRRSVR